MKQIDADKLEREITLAYIETCRGLTFEQIDAVARFSAKVISIIGHTPTADAEPVKHGRWETTRPDAPMFGFYYCPFCGRKRTSPQDNYCPNCGARMDGGENGSCD